jgi:glycosyltransferase involved in cell wall biosynthesis
MPPLVSVIVPVRNRVDLLRKCLAAACSQSFEGPYEIVVVDNDSSEDVAGVCRQFSGVICICETGVGSYAARNAGIRKARGEILAFTDSDCIPGREWLERAIEYLNRTKCDIVGGRIVYADPTDRALNIYEVFEESRLNLARQDYFVAYNYAVTANLVARRSAFETAGPFDSKLVSAGDKEWGRRAVAKGLMLKYSAEATVSHPRRSSHAAICAAIKRHSGARQLALLRNRRWGRAIYDLVAESPLSPQIPAFAAFCPGIATLLDRLRFAGALFHYSLIATRERLKVSCGGSVYRGD